MAGPVFVGVPIPSAAVGSLPVLRMSTLFLRTLRDDPADAEVPSHRQLVGERRETEWLRQRVSLAVVRGNAAAV